MDNKKKITAAISAVINYIQDEEAAIYMQSAMASAPATAALTSAEPPVLPALAEGPATPALVPQQSTPDSLWGASGRQSQMQLRSLMQLRVFNRF